MINDQETIGLFLKELHHGLIPAAKAAAWRILPQGFINLSSVPVKWQQSILINKQSINSVVVITTVEPYQLIRSLMDHKNLAVIDGVAVLTRFIE